MLSFLSHASASFATLATNTQKFANVTQATVICFFLEIVQLSLIKQGTILVETSTSQVNHC